MCDASPSSTATSSSSSSSSSRSIFERGVAVSFLGQIPIVTDRASRKSLDSLREILLLNVLLRGSFVRMLPHLCGLLCFFRPRMYYEFLSDEWRVAYSQIHASPIYFVWRTHWPFYGLEKATKARSAATGSASGLTWIRLRKDTYIISANNLPTHIGPISKHIARW